MKKFALILLAGASLLGTTGIASAQYYYGGGYYGRPGPYYGDPYRGRYYDGGYYQRRGYAYSGAIVGQDRYGRQELYYPVGRAVDARGTTQSKTVSANLIADTEICLRVEAAEVGGLFNSAIARSQCRHRYCECPLWVKSRHVRR